MPYNIWGATRVLCIVALIFLCGCASPKAVPPLSKTYKIIKVNDYLLPKNAPDLKIKFTDKEIHLTGTCNPTYGHYKVKENSIIFSAMGNLGQNACTELVELPDGSIQERVARIPSVLTEEEFIKIGAKTFKIMLSQNKLHFIDEDENTLIILEQISP